MFSVITTLCNAHHWDAAQVRISLLLVATDRASLLVPNVQAEKYLDGISCIKQM